MEINPFAASNFKNDQSYDIIIQDKNYILTLTDNSLLIKLSIISKDDKDSMFEESYNLEQLVKINKIFAMFDSIINVRNSIDEILNAKKYSIEKNDQNIVLILKISLFEKIIEVSLFLKKKKIDQAKLIGIMNQELKDLKEEIKELKNKNKEDIEKLNNEIIYLKNTNEKILKLFEEIQNKDKFRFCFRNGPNYTLSKNGKIAEKTNGGNNWNCSIIGDTPIPKYKLSKWKIRLNNYKYH
jgi:hypothetical protein